MADDSFGNDNSTCVVCFKNVLYYSIGECDHPVCFECSTRMRVLCLQNECPICRQPQARVIFVDSVIPYKELRNRAFHDKLFERQYKIGFCSEEIKFAYEKLLENRCKLCEKIPPFRNFGALSDHMRKVHERYYCDLCVKHLKIFTSERKCYTRQELGHHRRKGDPDNTSHRGHPLCEFCEERFMDADELYRHLRKEHLYCHLCDADGRNYYYATHEALAQHFRTDHYLCEEGECAGQHLTAVFRSEIDLKAHKASVHGKGLARAAARQARTLELQFNITPHPGAQQRNSRNNHHASNNNAPAYIERLDPNVGRAPPPPNIDTRSEELFPRLSAEPAPILLTAPHTRNRGGGGLVRDDRNFPALEGGAARPPPPAAAPPASAVLRTGKPSVSIQLHSQPASASHFRLTQPTGKGISIPAQAAQATQPRRANDLKKTPNEPRRTPLSDDDFPSLGTLPPRDDHPSIGAGTVQPPKVGLINSQEMLALKKTPAPQKQQAKKPALSAEAFPALSTGGAPTAPPQWIKVAKQKGKPKPEPAPQPRTPATPAFNPVADFPTLRPNPPAPNNKKHNPPPPKPAPPPEPNKQTKKDKKKQNEAKKENAINTNSEIKSARDSVAANSYQSACGSADDKKVKTVAERPVEQRNGGNGDFKYAEKDYPALKGDGGKKLPNGNVPPGFGKRPACDGMTFTNSAGQTFPAPVHQYIPPSNFEQRNRALVKKFTVALGSTDAVEGFKVASRAFRDSIMSAEEFYQHCQAAMGSQLDGVFAEMVALLPDIEKQQELVVGRPVAEKMAVCSVCGQLLAPADASAHDKAHWPALSSR